MGSLVKTAFVKKESIAEGTTTFYFEKPSEFNFVPGQFICLYINEQMHEFTLTSIPPDPFISITTRVRDSQFKHMLDALDMDDVVEVEGPFGKFILPEKVRTPIVMVAGGIGVTPFYSMIQEVTKTTQKHITLIHSIRSIMTAPFLDIFSKSDITYVPTITGDQDDWAGKVGRIDKELLQEFYSKSTLWYVSGSPGFVNAMTDLLFAMGVDEKKIKVDSFSGY